MSYSVTDVQGGASSSKTTHEASADEETNNSVCVPEHMVVREESISFKISVLADTTQQSRASSALFSVCHWTNISSAETGPKQHTSYVVD